MENGKAFMKVGTQWQRGWSTADAEFPEKRVDQYSWAWDTEPKANLPTPTRDFDIVMLRETAEGEWKGKLAFEVIAPAAGIKADGSLRGTFEIGDGSKRFETMGGIDVKLTTQPVPLGGGRGQAGSIDIDAQGIVNSKNGNGDQGWFYLFFKPETGVDGDGNAVYGDSILLHKIGVKPDKDLMGWNLGSSMLGGPFGRKGGKWVGEGAAPAGTGD